MFEKKYDYLELFCLLIIEFYFKKRNFEDSFSAKIEVSGWMKTNMAAASYRPANLKPQIWADGLRETVNHKQQFVVWSKMTRTRS